MRKFLVTTMILLVTCRSQALPINNPSDPNLLCDGLFFYGCCGHPSDPYLKWWNAFSLRAGFYGDYVFDRHLKTWESSSRIIERTKMYTNAASIILNIWDRTDIFTTLGETNLTIDTNSSAFGFMNRDRIHLETENEFSWSVGARTKIWECGSTMFGVEGQYFSTHPRVSRIDLAGNRFYPSKGSKYQEWQIGLGIAHRIHLFVPYVGVKWSGCNWRLRGESLALGEEIIRLHSLKNKNHFGFAVGCSLVECEKISLTVEGRWGDEKAVSVFAEGRF